MQPCSLLDFPCDCQRRCLVPKSWLRSLALRRKGVNIKRQSHQAQVKRTVPYEAVCRCLQIVFRCCFCGWKKVEMVGIFFQACGDLDVLKSLEDLHVVIDTLFRSKSSLHAISTLRKAARQISHTDMRCILSDFFFLLFRRSFFQGRAARNLCCQMQQYLCYGGGLAPSLSAISYYHVFRAALPNCQTLKACRCRPVVLEAALFSASEVGVALMSTHPWRQYCCVVWTQTFWTLCVVLYGQSPCDESLVSSHSTSTTKLWFTKTRMLVSLPSSGLYSETHGLFESSFGSKLRGLTTDLLCWSRLFHWHAHEQKSHDRHSHQSHLFCDFPLCSEQNCTGLWGCRRHWNAFWARLCPVPEQTLGQPNTSISRFKLLQPLLPGNTKDMDWQACSSPWDCRSIASGEIVWSAVQDCRCR